MRDWDEGDRLAWDVEKAWGASVGVLNCMGGNGARACRVVKETFGWSGFKFPASVWAGAAWEQSAVPVGVQCEKRKITFSAFVGSSSLTCILIDLLTMKVMCPQVLVVLWLGLMAVVQ